jgi:ribosomal protein S18 acetylase RimI-like enzyme
LLGSFGIKVPSPLVDSRSLILENQSVTPFLQASEALVASLIDDPFYLSISEGFRDDLEARKHALKLYFDYSLREAERTGRCVLAADPALGAAAWLLPKSPEVQAVESKAKAEYLEKVLGPKGYQNFDRIVGYMAPLAARVIPGGAWYLSIIGISPSAQGQGLGATLLAGTLAEASANSAPCFLETFTPRNLRFYERHGFSRVAEHIEPTTGKPYVVMLRNS